MCKAALMSGSAPLIEQIKKARNRGPVCEEREIWVRLAMLTSPLAASSIGSVVSLVTDTLRSFSLFRLADKLSLNWIPLL